MKSARIVYWTVTSLAGLLMLVSAIPDLLHVPQAISIINHLGYPPYLLLFLGIAKTLGALALVTPRLRRLKEWAYGGLTFDVTGALYSHLSVGDPPSGWLPAATALLLLIGSYVSYRRYLTCLGERADASSRAEPARAFRPHAQAG